MKSSINWKFIQKNSDEILLDGIFNLTKQPSLKFSEIRNSNAGNYLISNNKTNFYIGEGKNLDKRLKQQSKPNTSTFYKNYQKLFVQNSLNIADFLVQTINTNIGRKEIEEFGIVNLKTSLNKFQLKKRSEFKIQKNGLWNDVQDNFEQIINEAEKDILKNRFSLWYDCDVKVVSGLYIVKNKKEEIIYIGESSNIKERYLTHSSKTYFSALRRHIGTELFNFELIETSGRKRLFTEKQDLDVTKFLKNCNALFFPIYLGRYEIEEFLIRKYKPLLNRKDNKQE
ncbi:GIY-YIG nuclease family protein [Chryseobacterium sp. RR2-3-20]|uniref:GIY-YIG nuclease family protein n=1 Tax=Chryseobacterium sp. RR2-3-20 TaxID=2787626 RepID=UPI001ADF7689|nr:GIY-YIG nuclease family protein [Chryseobacterium sp. RR2-3-20]